MLTAAWRGKSVGQTILRPTTPWQVATDSLNLSPGRLRHPSCNFCGRAACSLGREAHSLRFDAGIARWHRECLDRWRTNIRCEQSRRGSRRTARPRGGRGKEFFAMLRGTIALTAALLFVVGVVAKPAKAKK